MTTAEDPGPEGCAQICSLRAAINAANESDGGDLIRFALAGPATIAPNIQLPALRGAGITLDATTQAGWSADRPPPIYLDGSRAGDAAGILIAGPSATVRGLGVGGFQRYGIGVIGAAARGAVVESNWLGMSADGRAAAPNRLSGVAVLGGAAGARIGGECAGCGNRIAGNSAPERSGHGVVIGGGGVVGARVIGNTIGLNADGRPLANDDGVLVVDSAQAELRGNIICASRVAGVEFRETRAASAVDGNRIGVTADGAPAGNDVGLFFGPGAARVTVGASERNIIAANRVGVAVEQGAREVRLQDNWIGLVPAPDSDDLADARPAPNLEEGVSIIAGASEVRVIGNQVLAGERGIVIGGADTSRISLQRNVVASGGAGAVGIEAREAADVRIGGDRGLGNAIRGVGVALLLAELEDAAVSHNRIGARFVETAFASAEETGVGVELGEGARRATIRENRIGGVAGAAVLVGGANARDNLITRNIFIANSGLDIDLADQADAPAVPTLLSYAVEAIPNNQLRSTIRGRGEPGTRVEIYVVGLDRPGALARAQVGGDGAFEAVTLVLAEGEIRAVGIARGGATSEFSAPFSAPARQTIPARAGESELHWAAVEGAARPVGEALAPLRGELRAAWRWSADEGWRGWSPLTPGDLNTLRTVGGGDALLLQLAPGPAYTYFSTESAVDADEGAPAVIELRRGFNVVSWNGPWTQASDALARLEAAQPGLLSIVEQWDRDEQRWRVIWPEAAGAWQPPPWGAPVLRLRATRDAVWAQGPNSPPVAGDSTPASPPVAGGD